MVNLSIEFRMTLDCSHLGVPLRKKWQWLPAAAASLLMQWLKKILEQQVLVLTWLLMGSFIFCETPKLEGIIDTFPHKRPHVPAKLLVKTWVVLHLCKAWPPLPTQKNADLRIYAKWSRKSFRNFIFQADDFRLFYYNFMSYVQFFNHF